MIIPKRNIEEDSKPLLRKTAAPPITNIAPRPTPPKLFKASTHRSSRLKTGPRQPAYYERPHPYSCRKIEATQTIRRSIRGPILKLSAPCPTCYCSPTQSRAIMGKGECYQPVVEQVTRVGPLLTVEATFDIGTVQTSPLTRFALVSPPLPR